MKQISPIVRELRRIRLEMKISRRDLAIDMDRPGRHDVIFNWEKGIHSPKINDVERWAEALGYELDLHNTCCLGE
jgi:transcriptional regulator with XRE-family HTH domain